MTTCGKGNNVIWYDILGSHPVAVVQYTFTHKQYIEQHKQKYIEQHIIDAKQYILAEQHSSLIRKNTDRASSLRCIPWHLSHNWGKSRKNLIQGSRRMPVGTMKTEYTEKSTEYTEQSKNTWT